MIRWLLLLASVVLLALLGCAGMDWIIHDHKNVIVALAGFGAAGYVASGLGPPPRS